MTADLVIRNGLIVDGTGSDPVPGDLAISDGKIVALGQVDDTGKQEVDATGHAVAPGFIDSHTHYDAQILWDRGLTISPWHGVTTVVMGNCGFGVAPTRPDHQQLILRTLERVEGMSLAALNEGIGPAWPFESFGEYLDAVATRGTAINVAAYIGHTPLRLYVMGEDAVRRKATPEEVAQMRDLVDEAMRAGAVGFSTSHSPHHVGFDGLPVPSRLADVADEIDPLVAAAAAHGGVMQATGGPTMFLDEFAALARKHDVTITWTALMAGLEGPGSHRPLLARSAALRAEGLRISPQATCRPLNFDFSFDEPTAFASLPMFAEPLRTDRAGREKLYRDPEFRAAFKASLAKGVEHPFAEWFTRTVISWAPSDRGLEEQPLDAAAAARGVDPVDLALDLSLENDLEARFRLAMFNYDADEVAEIMADPNIILGLSDAGAHASQLCDACFSTHLLAHWVRETGLLSLARGVQMLTSAIADVFGLDRGRLAVGLPADVVVFDPDTVAATGLRRIHDLPGGVDRLVADAVGIHTVICNGQIIRQHDQDIAQTDLPGTVLRPRAR
ncbi:MAG: amidohydrolase family protein [Alphaproteobacteria bacterium]